MDENSAGRARKVVKTNRRKIKFEKRRLPNIKKSEKLKKYGKTQAVRKSRNNYTLGVTYLLTFTEEGMQFNKA